MELNSFNNFLEVVDNFTKTKEENYFNLLETKGVIIKSLDEVFTKENGEFYLKKDKKEIKVVLYIAGQEVKTKKFDYKKIKDFYKYHTHNCQTLKTLFKKEHIFKITTRDKDFYYEFKKDNKLIHKELNQKLPLCKNCLKRDKK